MPRHFMFTREEIVNAALDLAREKGFAAVTARALGSKLGSSSRPIFSFFANMAEVQQAVVTAANELYQSYLKEDMEKGEYTPYKASGMAYIRFAREEKELFKLLFMRDRSEEKLEQTHEEKEAVVGLVGRQLGLSPEKAELFHLEMWLYVHGIATMIATGYINWDEKFASDALTDIYIGLKARFCDNPQAKGQ